MKKLGILLGIQSLIAIISAVAVPTISISNSHAGVNFNTTTNTLSTPRSNGLFSFTDILGFNNANGQTQLSNLHLNTSPLTNGVVGGNTNGGSFNLFDTLGGLVLGTELNNGTLSQTGNGRYQLTASNINLSGAASGSFAGNTADLVLYFEGLPQAAYTREQTGTQTVSSTVQGVIGQKTVTQSRTESYTESVTKFRTEQRQEAYTAFRSESYSSTQNTGRTCYNFSGVRTGTGWTAGCFFANEIGGAAYNEMLRNIGNILRSTGDLIISKQCFLSSTSPNDRNCYVNPNLTTFTETTNVTLTKDIPYTAYRTITDTIPYTELVTKYRDIPYTLFEDIYGPIITYNTVAVFGDVFHGYNWMSYLSGGEIIGQSCPAVPEPATIGLGIAGIALLRRRKKNTI